MRLTAKDKEDSTTRLGSLSAALTLCGLLALATSASAECAWVLWIQAGTSQGSMTIAFAGYARWEDCDKERATRQKPPPPGQDGAVFFICLPDTMDPRGPKGR